MLYQDHHNIIRIAKKQLILVIFFYGFLLAPSSFSEGQTKVDDLKTKIEERSNTIQKLEQEIDQYQTQVESVQKEAKTLQNIIKELTVTQTKLGKDINLTENKIEATNLTLEQLEIEIKNKERQVENARNSIMSSLRDLNEKDEVSFTELLLLYEHTSDYWNEIDDLETFQDRIKTNMLTLNEYRIALQIKKDTQEGKRHELVSQKQILNGQRQAIEATAQEKSKVLFQTKNKETEYQRILREKMTLRDAFEKELLEFEQQLKYEMDPSRLPTAGKGVLSWPLDTIRITQYFGNTEFSRSPIGAVYSGNGHNGIDLAVPIGTKVKSAASGVVQGTGDTDATCSGASYGKWILVKHYNGLTTLYAHLSVISAKTNDTVNVGDIIGYSGNTGYSTGPHLHFTVYASDSVHIISKKSAVCRGTYTLPAANLKAYLDPMQYL